MKFLFRSGWGESLAIARQVEAEGHEVLMVIAGKEALHVGDGLISKSRDWPKAVKWADIIIFDGGSYDLPKEAELLRKTKPLLGSSDLADKLEHDRLFAIDLVKRAGLKVPEHKEFEDFDKARRFIADKEGGWVLKPNSDTFKTFVSDSPEEMMRMFDYYERRFEEEKEKPVFILEQKHEGTEVSTEAWFDGEGWSLPNGTAEKSRLMDGNLGEQTGCSGNLVWLYKSMEEPLPKMLLSPLTQYLKGKYRGPVDVNAMIDKETNEPLFLEFSPRFGYSAIFSLAMLVEEMSDLLSDIAIGKPFTGAVKGGFALGVRVSIPPYPATQDNISIDYPIFGFDAENVDKRICPMEVCLDENNEAETSGPDGIVFEMVGYGSSIQDATEDVYKAIKEVKIPNMRYRRDIGEETGKVFRKLVSLGAVRREGIILDSPSDRSYDDDKWSRLLARTAK